MTFTRAVAVNITMTNPYAERMTSSYSSVIPVVGIGDEVIHPVESVLELYDTFEIYNNLEVYIANGS